MRGRKLNSLARNLTLNAQNRLSLPMAIMLFIGERTGTVDVVSNMQQ